MKRSRLLASSGGRRNLGALGVGIATALFCALSCGGRTPADETGPSTGGSLDSVGGSTGTGGASSGGGNPSAGGTGPTSSGGSAATGGTGALGGSGPEGGELHSGSPPSCDGFDGTECAGDDCCASLFVPGGVVEVEGSTQTLPGFYLDKFEVTVARFRQYMNALDAWAAAGNPTDGAGAHPLVSESGWRSAWLEITSEEGEEDVAHLELYEYFTDPERAPSLNAAAPTYALDGSGQLAVNFATVHAAFAFCIWDGGRLPGAAEWLYAAHGGDAHTALPWGEVPPLHEVFAELPPALPEPYPDARSWQYVGIPVGSHPAARGRFGHEDLIGGLIEFVRDTWPGTLEDSELIELTQDDAVHPIIELSDRQNRTAVGLDWSRVSPGPIAWDSTRSADDRPSGANGFRCARDP